MLLDLGPVVGSNVNFFGDQLGCKIFIEDIYAEIERQSRERKARRTCRHFCPPLPPGGRHGRRHPVLGPAGLPRSCRPPRRWPTSSRVCSGRKARCSAFFGTAQPRDTHYTKLHHRRRRQSEAPAVSGVAWPSGDRCSTATSSGCSRGLRVSDSFLLQNNLREILFRKPSYENSLATSFHGAAGHRAAHRLRASRPLCRRR